MATQLVADSRGTVRGKFTIPAGVPSGNKLVTATGMAGLQGSASFAGQGTLERRAFQQQTTILETRWTSPPPAPPVTRGSADPLAQTFSTTKNVQATSVDLFFTKASTTTTRVQIRGTTVGFPNSEVLAEAILHPSQIAVPPLVVGASTTLSLTGTGNIVVPAGVLSVSVQGRGTGGVAAVTALAPTFGSWIYAGVSPTNALNGSFVFPFSSGTPPASFTSGSVAWTDGTTTIAFTRVDSTRNDNYVEYVGRHPFTGVPIMVRATRETLTSGRTAVAAQPGVATTFSLNGNDYTFPGAASGVATAPAETTQTISIPGTSPLTLSYTVPDNGVLAVTYNAVSQAPGSATRATFPYPVLLLSGVEYAIVVLCDDPIGSLAVGELGKFDSARQQWVTSQPYIVGTLLSSSNARTWTPHQDRDMAFRLNAAAYTTSTRTFDLGKVSVTDATDLLLMSYAERPASSTNVEYQLTLPDSSVVTVSDGQPVQLPSKITGDVLVSAVISGVADMAPVLFPGTQLVSGTLDETANYVSRAMPAGTSATIKVIFEAVIPSGAGVTVSYKGIDAGDTWAAISSPTTRPADDGFVEFTYTVTGVNETAIQTQLVLTGTAAARPRVRDLRIIVL